MRSKLLFSTAVLLAGVGLASAQNMPGGGQSGGGQGGAATQHQGAPGGAAGQERQGGQSQRDQRAQQPGQQGQRGQKDQTTGQAPQREPGAQSKEMQKEKGGQGRDIQKGKDQQTQRDQRGNQTTGQGAREQNQRQPGQETGQPPTQNPAMQRDQREPGQSAQGQQRQGGGSATLTTEQRTKIRETVLAGGSVPRASNVNFSISVGTVVPTTVRVVEVPSVIVEVHPEWRGYMYFVVGDEIIIVDRGHKIVAVLAV
jgi:uncharacterized protein DUF1236